GQKRSPLDAFPFTSYTTIDLKTRYVLDPNLTQEVDEVWVETASYYKQKQSPQHEFIIFSVTSTSGMQNFIALDRNVNVKGSASLVSRGGKSGPPAQDYFHISHYADIGSLISHCGNTASEELCTHVEQVAFEPKAFSFPQLVVLASTVSESCPSYQLGATNCYWFASLIWECMFNVFAEGVTRHKKNTEERGRFRGLKIQGAHGNFEEVVEKYKKDIAEFSRNLTDEATIVMNRRSRRMSALPSNPPDFEKDSNAPAASMESRRSRAISTVTTLGASATAPRAQVTGEQDRKAERSRATSMCPSTTSKDTGSRLSASINKDLPSIPPSTVASQPPRSLTHPIDDRRRGSKAMSGYNFDVGTLPDSVKRGSNRYSDIGKSFEQATAAYNQPSSRPASSYAIPAPKQVQFESNSTRIPDSARLKVLSLPTRPVSPNGDYKDRPRSPSLPVGSTPPEIRDPTKNSSELIVESPDESAPQRKRTTSGLIRLRRALPKILLLPTVSESQDTLCESPDEKSTEWVELDPHEFVDDYPVSDDASDKLSVIDFPPPPGSRIAQGHLKVRPKRVEYVDSPVGRRSSRASVDRDSRHSLTRS
ncbi:unnamed protein product, partial [Rhizoctonia solani]